MFDELNTLFRSTRYPDEVEMFIDTLTEERVERLLKETKRIFVWLEKKLK